MLHLGNNGEGLPGNQRSVNKGSQVQCKPSILPGGGGQQRWPLKQPVPCGARAAPTQNERITDVKRCGPRPALTRCRCTGRREERG